MNESLPPPRHLILFGMLLPAVVVFSNMLLINLAPREWLRMGFPFYMTASIAVLSWCSGRYLSKGQLGWIVFAWSLILLDLLTIASLGPVEFESGYILVSAQVGVLMLWALLARVGWQWRLPSAAAAAAIVIFFAGNITSGRYERGWGMLMLIAGATNFLACGGLRWRGFVLQNVQPTSAIGEQRAQLGTHQFGIKHMLFWTAAIVPPLLILRSATFDVFTRFNWGDLVPAAIVAATITLVNLSAIWLVLGMGSTLSRVAVALAALALSPVMLEIYSGWITPTRNTLIQRVISQVGRQNNWAMWICLNMAMLAAMLLFLRAHGFRLLGERINQQESSAVSQG